MQLERRYTSRVVETRAGSDGSKNTVGGYAAVFNSDSKDLWGVTETIDPAAFEQSASDGWPGVMARYNHEDNYLLGTTAGGTLRLSTDDTGLIYDVDLPDARADVYELIGRGDISKSSFAFYSEKDEWTYNDDEDVTRRHVLVARLVDVAPVNNPAYDAATVGLRSLADSKSASVEDVEQLAASGELRKLFKRSDVATDKTLFGPVAKLLLMKEQHGA